MSVALFGAQSVAYNNSVRKSSIFKKRSAVWSVSTRSEVDDGINRGKSGGVPVSVYLQSADETDGRADEYVADDGANDDGQKGGADQDGLYETVAGQSGLVVRFAAHHLAGLIVRLRLVDHVDRQPRRRMLQPAARIHRVKKAAGKDLRNDKVGEKDVMMKRARLLSWRCHSFRCDFAPRLATLG